MGCGMASDSPSLESSPLRDWDGVYYSPIVVSLVSTLAMKGGVWLLTLSMRGVVGEGIAQHFAGFYFTERSDCCALGQAQLILRVPQPSITMRLEH